MDCLARSQQHSMEIKKIICVGNQTAESDDRAKHVATQYKLDFTGRPNQTTWKLPGCSVITPLVDLDLDTYRLAIEQSDVIVVLDQPKHTFQNFESWQKIQTSCTWMSHFKSVVYENHNTNLYMLHDLKPSNTFNSTIVQVNNNSQIFKEIYKHNLTDRQVILQFMNLQDQDQDEFLLQVNQLVRRCRASAAKFLMFRASEHEPDPVHYKITRHFCQYPEFVLLKPSDFLNLERTVNQHWHRLYRPLFNQAFFNQP